MSWGLNETLRTLGDDGGVLLVVLAGDVLGTLGDGACVGGKGCGEAGCATD